MSIRNHNQHDKMNQKEVLLVGVSLAAFTFWALITVGEGQLFQPRAWGAFALSGVLLYWIFVWEPAKFNIRGS